MRLRYLASSRIALATALTVLVPWVLLALGAGLSHASCTSQAACIPATVNCGYTSTCSVLFAPGFLYRNLAVHDFSSCAMVLPGMVTGVAFSCTVDVDVSFDVGSTWSTYQGLPGQGHMTFAWLDQNPAGTDRYTSSLDQLDFSGGGLPVGVQFRESPVQASMGLSTDRWDNSSYHIDSFFDVFVELSIDGGNTWYPPMASCNIVLGPTGPTPVRASTWGSVKTLYR